MALWPSLFPQTASISCRVGSHWLPPHPRKFFPKSVNFPKLPEIFSQLCWLANWSSLVSSQVLGCPTIHNPVLHPQSFPDTSDLHILKTAKFVWIQIVYDIFTLIFAAPCTLTSISDANPTQVKKAEVLTWVRPQMTSSSLANSLL